MNRRKFLDMLRKTGLMSIANSLFNLRNRAVKSFAKLVGKSDIDIIYTKEFFLENIDLTTESARKSAAIFIKYLKPKSILDFGCGPGIYLREFEKKGLKIKGIDGSAHAKENAVIDKEKIQIMDLRKKIKVEGKFDLTMCFEVAEHIDTKFSKTLVENITKNSNIVLFTAAKKGQGGTDHINEQDPRFWIDIFAEQGFIFQKDLTMEIKEKLAKENIVWWLTDNLLIFKRK